jgi:hypothetical protein
MELYLHSAPYIFMEAYVIKHRGSFNLPLSVVIQDPEEGIITDTHTDTHCP